MKHVVLTLLAVALLLGFPLAAQAGVKYKVLHHFGSGKDGATPYGPLAFDGDKLYGVTISGGTGCNPPLCGTVFRLSPQASGKWQETILYSFPGGDYSYPNGVLVFHRRGNIYGTMGGNKGGVFKLSPAPTGWDFTALYTGGAERGILIDDLGNLFGEMGPGQDKAGAIGELSPGSSGWNYTQLYSFCSGNSCPDGVNLPTPPIWDGKGNMFGTTTNGGIYSNSCLYYTNGCGVIFEMSPNGDGTWSYHVLYRFGSFKNDGDTPRGGLVMDKAGNLYGTTVVGGRYGGGYGNGTVFKLAYRDGRWKETILYEFPNCYEGCAPWDNLVFDKAGNLYGANGGGRGTCAGGAYFCGMIYKLTPQSNGRWKYSSVYKFHGGDGFGPYGVILDGKGHIFGATERGGTHNAGVAFEITP